MNHEKYINIPSPILISGETGTGKSTLAKTIYKKSTIHREKWLAVNLASLKEDLLESELFGHRKGSFTGALENKNGYFKDVGSGTIFLDEIGELSLAAQKKLLQVLEEKEYTPVGSTTAQKFCGRVIMATNKNLAEMVKKGEFREDLYFRINVFHLHLPRFVANRETILEILNEMKVKYHKPQLLMPAEIMNELIGREWKGNIRELKNTIEFAVAMSEGELRVSDFSLNNQKSMTQKETFIQTFPEDFSASLELFEKLYLETMLEKYAGKVNETARRLGLSKTTLIYKSRKYQINTLKMRAIASEVAA